VDRERSNHAVRVGLGAALSRAWLQEGSAVWLTAESPPEGRSNGVLRRKGVAKGLSNLSQAPE
jgi:hypothetical protein